MVYQTRSKTKKDKECFKVSSKKCVKITFKESVLPPRPVKLIIQKPCSVVRFQPPASDPIKKEWNPQVFDWKECATCKTFRLEDGNGCKTCRLWARLTIPEKFVEEHNKELVWENLVSKHFQAIREPPIKYSCPICLSDKEECDCETCYICGDQYNNKEEKKRGNNKGLCSYHFNIEFLKIEPDDLPEKRNLSAELASV